MEYRIERNSDDLMVYQDGVKIMDVKRRSDWWGIQTTRCWYHGELVLISTFDESFWRIRMKIKYQDEILRV